MQNLSEKIAATCCGTTAEKQVLIKEAQELERLTQFKGWEEREDCLALNCGPDDNLSQLLFGFLMTRPKEETEGVAMFLFTPLLKYLNEARAQDGLKPLRIEYAGEAIC
ncbi:hypothetical protein F9L16_15945 [Agarivorans sp. B2Z047]|uniref:hypothetical protein n=1 Tax=Agarivorans sp. B2Z047 TaxID=2652721 RepID=UPI00128B9B64|nr:hypothetical protein [Agarivorans sp. B2Z047]MPW30479.1 hypothetical protein [Agarivorans sp. B2Z047]UQN42301.1 hypothetical protein LQZ07_21400 [Agarivorans sp. B2Z047]